MSQHFTPACYTHITDNDYRPLPEEQYMDIERDIDRVVEAHRDADVDALVDGKGDALREDEPEAGVKLPPDASLLAVALADAYRAYAGFSGLISIGQSATDRKVIRVFVTEDYFMAHYGSEPDLRRVEIPAHGAIEISVALDGAEIFCWQEATFRMVAA